MWGPHNFEILDLLLVKGSDPSLYFGGTVGLYPLRLTTRSGKLEVVQILVSHGANANEQSAQGWTALHEAAMSRDAEPIVRYLITGTAANLEPKLSNGSLPIHIAAQKNNNNGIVAFLKYGCDINVKNYDDRMLLHVAASERCVDVVRLLVNRGASVDTQDQNRMALLDTVWFEQANKYSSYLGNQERHQNRLQI